MSEPTYHPDDPVTVDELLRLMTPIVQAMSSLGAAAIHAGQDDATAVNAASELALSAIESASDELRALLERATHG